MDFLKNEFRFISICGAAGIGKTSLALNFAHSIVKAGTFEAVVWTTPKRFELKSQTGFLNLFNPG